MAEQERACGAPCGQCRECNPIMALAERVDAWKTAESLLFARQWGSGDDVVVIGPETVHGVAEWLLYGPDNKDDD